MKAAIITIGTEVTSGEIVNSNSSLLASKLTDAGITCDLHLAVPDERKKMLWALRTALDSYPLVICTGGLGPTTDDFTRDVIADISGKQLIWDENAWRHIESRLNSVNAPIAESNKQQAWFPDGADIFQNNQGTAAGFAIAVNQSFIIAFPGPPHEINALWDDHIRTFITSKFPDTRNIKPQIWRCLGLSESKVGELTEAALKNSRLVTGYRAELPFIDVKVWVPDEQMLEFQKSYQPALELALTGFITGRNGDDAAATLWSKTPPAIPIYILDRATGGYIAKRLNPLSGNQACQLSVVTSSYSCPPPKLDSAAIVCTITANIESGAWQIVLTGDGPHKSFSEVCRYRGKANASRLGAYIGEKSLLKLVEWFN